MLNEEKDHAIPRNGAIIAAPSSGSGKTLLTLGLLKTLVDRGASIASVKIGPDYIDPAFHAAATGRPCFNLDPWAMRAGLRAHILGELIQHADTVICEGVMGLFDGATAREGSTADIAAETGWPVILVVDARSQATSAAAVVRGFEGFRSDVKIGGVIFNRLGSSRHCDVIRDSMAHYVPDIPVLGYLPRHDVLELPSRHLGLVQAVEHAGLVDFLDQSAELINEHVDIETLLAIINTPSPVRMPSPRSSNISAIPPLGQRIAVASDEAFAFSYPHILEGWCRAGAEIKLFSPLADEPPWPDADAIYLPGGYPELHAGRLAAGSSFIPALRQAADHGVRVFGECGGYMVLGDGLVDADDRRHAMAGLLPLETSFAKRKLHLGYRQVELADSQGGNGGLTTDLCRGHEFHYATTVREGDAPPLFRTHGADGNDLGTAGLCRGSVAGSFIHLIDQWESHPENL